MKKQLSKFTRTRLLWRNGKKVRAHRWIMEQFLGRKLIGTEQVHHINGNPLDNDLSNLMVLNRKFHMQLHKQKHPDIKQCVVCDKTFIVNPKHRGRNKCCSSECAHSIPLEAKRQKDEERQLNDTSERYPSGRRKFH